MTDLAALHAGAGAPAILALDDQATLVIQRSARYVPDRRLVCEATWQQQKVYAKIFTGEQARRYAARDSQGSLLLSDAGLLTPALLHETTLDDGQAYVLIYAAVMVTGNAEDDLRKLAGDSQGRLALIRLLTNEVARHHNAGLLQTDLYLKNFLIDGEQVYTLDGDGIRRLSRWRPHRQALSNLATLLSKMDAADDIFIAELYQAYCQRRGWTAQSAECGQIRCQAAKIRRKVVAGYADKKVFRTCSDVQVAQTSRRFLAVARPWVELLEGRIDAPDAWLNEAGSRFLKLGNTCTVGLVETAGRKVVIKRYNIKNFWHGLSRALRPTRAAASWANAHRLMMYGIATAAPVALLEQRYGFIRRQAYFLAEYVEAPDAVEFFADASVDAARKTAVAENIARLFYKLHLLRIDHGDFKATNMKIVDGQPWLLDLDSMCERRYAWFFRKRHVRDLRRFMRNWQQDRAVQDLLAKAFYAVYKDTGLLVRAGIK